MLQAAHKGTRIVMQVSEARIASLVAGNNLRASRERLGMTMRDVENASMRLATRHGNEEFLINPSRLSAAANLKLTLPPKSHCSKAVHGTSVVQMPTRLDPSFDSRRTSHLSRMVEKWGVVPFTYLSQFASDKYTYGYIGSEDFTMYPLLPPGTFLQVDESKNKVLTGMWRSEIERPIYFVETRDGYTCSWCMLKGDYLVLQPHPLSPVQVRVLRHPQDAEVIGQVVGIALKLGDWRPVESLPDSKPDSKERVALN